MALQIIAAESKHSRYEGHIENEKFFVKSQQPFRGDIN